MKTLLVIGKVWPEPTASAAGLRILQIIDVLVGDGWSVTFACAANRPEHHYSLSDIGVVEVEIELNNSSFDILLERLNPTVVLFDRFMTEEQFGWRVAQGCPNALRILDTEDLHSLRMARKKALDIGKPFKPTDLLVEEMAKRELAAIFRSDLSLIIAQYEIELLKSVFKVDGSLLHYLPFMVDAISEYDIANWPKFDERQHFVTIGNFLHEPNWDSIRYLKEFIWPVIRTALPEAEMHVYGSYATEKNHQLNDPKLGFLIKGFAQNSRDVLKNARVCLAPLRFGAGLKGKLLEAMQCGTPSVTTSIGAESMNDEKPWPGLIKDDPFEFAQAAVQLYQDNYAWNQAQLCGAEIVNSRFIMTEHCSALLARINALSDGLSGHRNANFIGSMLHYHQHRSTEYLSRWIEAKNASR